MRLFLRNINYIWLRLRIHVTQINLFLSQTLKVEAVNKTSQIKVLFFEHLFLLFFILGKLNRCFYFYLMKFIAIQNSKRYNQFSEQIANQHQSNQLKLLFLFLL